MSRHGRTPLETRDKAREDRSAKTAATPWHARAPPAAAHAPPNETWARRLGYHLLYVEPPLTTTAAQVAAVILRCENTREGKYTHAGTYRHAYRDNERKEKGKEMLIGRWCGVRAAGKERPLTSLVRRTAPESLSCLLSRLGRAKRRAAARQPSATPPASSRGRPAASAAGGRRAAGGHGTPCLPVVCLGPATAPVGLSNTQTNMRIALHCIALH